MRLPECGNVEPGKGSGSASNPPLPTAFQAERFVAALDETVVYEKTPHRTVVVRADGTRQSPRAFRDAAVRAHRAKHGSLTAGLSRYVEDQIRTGPIRVAVYVSDEVDWKTLGRKIWSFDTKIREAAERSYRTKVAAVATKWAARLEEFGFKDVQAGKSSPVVFARGSAEKVRSIAARSGVRMVSLAEPTERIQGALDPVALRRSTQSSMPPLRPRSTLQIRESVS